MDDYHAFTNTGGGSGNGLTGWVPWLALGAATAYVLSKLFA